MSHALKTALCGLYKYTGAARLQEVLDRRAGRTALAVLLLHRVSDAIPEDGLTLSVGRFRRLCRLLRRDFRVVPLHEVFRLARAGTPPPPRTVAVTFDDCYRDNLAAARILSEHGLPATFFLPTAFVGSDRVFPWDRGLPRLPNLTWEDVRVMAGLGFELGSHTITHADLGSVPAEQALRELVGSKAELEGRLGVAVRWLAYPFGGVGNFRREILDLAADAGYEGCLSGYGGLVGAQADPRLLPRVPVPPFRSLLALELYLTGALRWYYDLKDRLGLLVPYRGPDVALPCHPDPTAAAAAVDA
jgi:peptidoglycan/xylan/chitin deacetylase (PgdA/CDA1 family)